MAADGPEAAALGAAGPTTSVPWQDCLLATDDFLVVRMLETVVHADDLAVSVGLSTPALDDERPGGRARAASAGNP